MPVSSFNDVMCQKYNRKSVAEVLEFLKTNPSNDDIHDFLSHDLIISPRIQLEIFKHIAKPNDKGVSGVISNDILFKIHSSFAAYHGSWRSYAKRDMGLNLCLSKDGSGYYLNGYLNPDKSDYIRPDIHREIKRHPCARCGSKHTLQTDHKNGRKDDPRVWNFETQTVHDFQCLCQDDNLKKKSACEKCLKCGLRPDARNMPEFRLSPFGWTEGGQEYDEVHKCHGCVWHDIEDFRLKYEIAMGLRNNHQINTIQERYKKMNIIKELIERIPSSDEMNGIARIVGSQTIEDGEKFDASMQIVGLGVRLDILKSALQNMLSQKESPTAEPTGKKSSSSYSVSISDLKWQMDYVYKDGATGIYMHIKKPDGGKGMAIVLGYDSEHEWVKAQKEGWFSDYEDLDAIASVRQVRKGLKCRPVMRTQEEWKPECPISEFKPGASFVHSKHFRAAPKVPEIQVVESGATPAQFTSGTQLSQAS